MEKENQAMTDEILRTICLMLAGILAVGLGIIFWFMRDEWNNKGK